MTTMERTAAVPVGPPATPWLARHWTWVLVLVGVASWALGLRRVDPAGMDGYGLIGRLTVPTLLGYPLVLAGLVGELARTDRRTGVLAGGTALLTFTVLGLQPAVESAARLQVAWLHAGFAEYIGTTGDVLPAYDARFSWAGFFAAAAFVARAAGLTDPGPLLAWAPLVLGGLGVLAMRALAQGVFGTRRLTWIATWIFLLANWTEQEYFSPQAVASVLFVAALAVVVRYLVRPGLLAASGIRSATTARHRIWAQFVVVALVTAMAPTHQLTPYVLVGMLLVLLLWRRLATPWLPLYAAVPVVAWFVLGARDYWQGNLGVITGAIGKVDSAVTKGIGNRIAGDTGHQLMVAARIGLTLVVGLLALAGLVLLWRRGVRSPVLPVLAGCSFGLVLLQPYGGEVFIRSYLYALPWLAVLAAVAVGRAFGPRTDPDGHRRRASTGPRGAATTVVTVVLLALGLTTVAARGGNDAYVGTTTADHDAMTHVYDSATAGDTVVALLWYSPLRRERVGDLVQSAADRYASTQVGCGTADGIAGCVAAGGAEWVVVNPQQEAAGEILRGFPAGWLARSVDELVGVHGYTVVFSRDGAQVLMAPGAS